MTPPELSVSAFAASLPAEYRERFNPAQIAIHAHTRSKRQNGALLVASLFPWPHPRQSALCVIAPDQPGLLALISSALTQSGFEVDAAEAYTKQDTHEAVDIFWLRDPHKRITQEAVEAFCELAAEILSSRSEHSLQPPPPAQSPAPSGQGTTVRFLEDAAGALTVLEIETDDRSGLLWAITRALYKQNVQIVGSKIRTENARVYDRFTLVELDGTPIRDERRFMIQVEILSAIGH